MATRTQRAQEYVREAREHLRRLAGVGNPQRGYFPQRTYTAGGLPRQGGNSIGFDVQYGVEPSDADVQRFIDAAGGNPYSRPARSPQQRTTPGTARTAAAAQYARAFAPQEPQLVEQMLENVRRQQAQARAENVKRYEQGLLGRLGAYNRTMAEVDNFNKAQAQLNEERAAEALANQKAELAARGLANSNVGSALAQRSARDLALVQQALSESTSNRKIGFDTALTDELLDAVERRNDAGPDPNQTLALAMQYAQAQTNDENASLRQQVDDIKRQLRGGQRAPSSRAPATVGAAPAFLGPGALGIPAAASGALFNNLRSGPVAQGVQYTPRQRPQRTTGSVSRAAKNIGQRTAAAAEQLTPAVAPAFSPAYFAGRYAVDAIRNNLPAIHSAARGFLGF